MDQPDGDIAAENFPGVGAQAFAHGRAQRADAGNRGDTERKTGQKDAEPAHAGAQFAAGEAGGDPQIAGEAGHSAAVAVASP